MSMNFIVRSPLFGRLQWRLCREVGAKLAISTSISGNFAAIFRCGATGLRHTVPLSVSRVGKSLMQLSYSRSARYHGELRIPADAQLWNEFRERDCACETPRTR